jgi:hypothetical protein
MTTLEQPSKHFGGRDAMTMRKHGITGGPRLWLAARLTILSLMMVTGAAPAVAATLIDDASLVATTSSAASREFSIVTSGRYELTLTDVRFPVELRSVQAAVTFGSQRVAALDATGKVQFDAVPGKYEVQVAGVALAAVGAGSFSVTISAVPSGTVVLDYSDTVTSPTPPPPAGQSTLQTRIEFTTSGAHRIAFTDLKFPAALANAALLLTRGGGDVARLNAADTTADFVASPGAYDLLIVAQAGSPALAGSFGVQIRESASGAVVFDRSSPVGTLGAGTPVTLASTGVYSFSIADLRFPVALQGLSAALVRGTEVLGSLSGPGSASLNATAGQALLYAMPSPAAPSTLGAMSVELLSGTSRVVSSIFLASPPATSGEASMQLTQFEATPASHRIAITDFDFPAPLADLQLGVFQYGGELGRRTGAGSIEVTPAAGPVSVLVAARPTGSSGSGLYGTQAVSSPANARVFETTQAVGAGFERRVVNVPTAGSHDVTVTDLQFPRPFAQLAAAVTRGTDRVGFVFGSGTFSFNAVPGDYFVNLITQVDASSSFGLYGLRLAGTPPSPVVTLSANPTSVTSGGTSTLQWTSSNAASCVASGQWSGNKAASGSESVGPLSADSNYTITCTGPGGTASRSVSVTVTPPKSGSGGGGSNDVLTMILALAALGSAARRR